MALSVDRFDLIADEIFSIFSSIRDSLAVLGTYYVLRKSLTLTGCVLRAIKTHVISRIFPVDLVKTYGPWAVVTGCTGGIGQEYCMNLAANGLNLVLISRSPKKISQLAEHIEQTFHVQTATIAVDFNDGRKVYDVIRKGLEGKEIGILVNNVGVMYDYPMYFLQVAEEKLWQLVHCNVAAATMMTHMILPQMVRRGRGAVINMASGASSMPAPLIAVYSATKAYLDYFSRALSHEYAHFGVTIQCVRPFYVATRMTQYSQTLSNPNLAIPSAATFARHALTTLGWSSRTSGYWPHTLQSWMVSLIPEWLWMWGATRLNQAFQRQADHRIRHRSGSHSRSRRPSGALLMSTSASRETLTSRSTSRDTLLTSSVSRENFLSASPSRETLSASTSKETFLSPSFSRETLVSGSVSGETLVSQSSSGSEYVDASSL